jgi:hypothetical protein
MRTLTDSELAVAGGATLAINAATAGVAGLAVGAPAAVTANPGRRLPSAQAPASPSEREPLVLPRLPPGSLHPSFLHSPKVSASKKGIALGLVAPHQFQLMR